MSFVDHNFDIVHQHMRRFKVVTSYMHRYLDEKVLKLLILIFIRNIYFKDFD